MSSKVTGSLLLILLLGSTLSFAAVLTGRVLSTERDAPLNGASVVLSGTRMGAMTDSLGNFRVEGIPKGEYLVAASLIGYLTSKQPVKLLADTTRAFIEFRLAPAPVEGDEVIITSSRYQQLRTSTPSTVNLLTEKALKRTNPLTFDQAMEQVPGVLMTRSGPLTLSSLSLRGASDSRGGGIGNRVLLMLDGRPLLTGDTGGGLWTLLPMGLIQRVEIVKGTASALYGGYAMGGVVNVITREPSTSAQVDATAELGWFEPPPKWMRFDNVTKGIGSFSASFSDRYGDFGLLGYATWQASGNYKQNSDYRMIGTYVKGLWDISTTHRLWSAAMFGQGENGYPASWLSTSHPLEVEPRSQDNRQNRGWINLDINDRWNPTDKWELTTHLFGFYHDLHNTYNPDSTVHLLDNQPYGLQSRSVATKLGLSWQATHHFQGEHWATFGLDWQSDLVDAWPDTMLYGKHQVNYLGLYGEYQVNLITWLNLTLGGREDLWKEVGRPGQQDFNPKAGVVVHPTATGTGRISFGQAFRYPTIGELYLRKNATYELRFLYNPNLGPEKITFSGEIGWNQRLGDWGSIDAAAFFSRYRNMIYWATQPSGDVMPVNLTSTDIRGFEAELTLHRSFWRINGGVGFIDGKDNPLDTLNLVGVESMGDATGSILLYKPRWTVNFLGGVDFITLFGGWPVEATLSGRWVSQTDRVFFYQTDAPAAHLVMDANVAYTGIRNFTLRLGVRNLGDVQYEEMERYRLPGRTWLIDISTHFGGE